MLKLGTQVGRYKLLRLIGHGGMGFVYEGEHVDLGKHVAIKALHPQVAAGAEGRERFLREGRAAAMLSHPNVCEVFDFGQHEDTLYLVMELLAGENLDVLIARDGLISAQRTADLMLPVLAAVGTLHDKGILHRDLKPANIFLARGPYGEIVPKVLDFGIAKLTDASRGITAGNLLGTPHYVPPEQVRGKQLDERSDQYSLGVILYEMLGGAKPVNGPNLPSIMQEIVTGTIRPLHHLAPDVPAGAEAAVLKALSKDPAKRHPSVFALGAGLLAYASERTQAFWAPVFEGTLKPAPPPPPKVPTPVPPKPTGASAAKPAPATTPARPAAQTKIAPRPAPVDDQEEETGPLLLHSMVTVPETAEDAASRATEGLHLFSTADRDAAEGARTLLRTSKRMVVLCAAQGPSPESKPPLVNVLAQVAGMVDLVVFVQDPEKSVWQDPMEEVCTEFAPGQPYSGSYLFFKGGRLVQTLRKDLFNPPSDAKRVREFVRADLAQDRAAAKPRPPAGS